MLRPVVFNVNRMDRVLADSLADFTLVGFYGFLQFVLTVRNEPGMATLADFIKRAKSKPPLTSGAGTPSPLMGSQRRRRPAPPWGINERDHPQT